MQYGAGAAAFLLGAENVAAEIIGSASSTTLLVDHFRAAGAAYDYFWEERWIRDEGYLKIGVEAVRAALANAKVAAADVAKLIFPSPSKGVAEAIARADLLRPAARRERLRPRQHLCAGQECARRRGDARLDGATPDG